MLNCSTLVEKVVLQFSFAEVDWEKLRQLFMLYILCLTGLFYSLFNFHVSEENCLFVSSFVF